MSFKKGRSTKITSPTIRLNTLVKNPSVTSEGIKSVRSGTSIASDNSQDETLNKSMLSSQNECMSPTRRTSKMLSGGKNMVKMMTSPGKAQAAPRGLNVHFLAKKMALIFPEMEHLFVDPKMIRRAFAAAKMTTPVYGPSRIHFEMEVERGSNLIFVEFLVFLCLLTRKMYSSKQVSVNNEAFNEDLRLFL